MRKSRRIARVIREPIQPCPLDYSPVILAFQEKYMVCYFIDIFVTFYAK
jgi:hypothetical protein